MKLNSAQKSAVEYLAGPLLVLAGPGTGKTQLLSERVRYILENTDTAPENILCITFTESGVETMRQRLESKIGPAAQKIRIHTYHAFGSDILSQYKNYAPEFTRQITDNASEVIQHKIIRQIQKDLPPFDILRGDRIKDIIATISEAKSARLQPDDLIKIATANLTAAEQINATADPILQKTSQVRRFPDGAELVYQPLLEALNQFYNPKPIVQNVEKEVNTLIRDLANTLETELAKDKPSLSPLTKWKDRYFERDEQGNYRLSNLVANKKLLSLSHIMEQYNNYLSEHGLYDYADMIEEAIRILQQDNGFRLTLAERYQYILLDEFQDTNPSQFELIKLITVGEKPDVMAVGDDDQAIYEFQGATASNLLDFQAHYQAHVINLTDNYRSTQDILNFARQIADQIDTSFAKKQNITKQLVAKRDQELQPNSTIERHEFLTADLEYLWVAQQIHKLINSGTKASEIAIICPKHKYIPPLLPYLKDYPDINISYEKRENILEYPAIHQLLTLAEFIYDLSRGTQPTHQLLEILSYPFWELEPATILSTTQSSKDNTNGKKDHLQQLTTSTDQKLQSIGALLSALVITAQNSPLELFLDQLIGITPFTVTKQTYTSPFLSFYTQSPDSDFTFSLYQNLSTLREKIKTHLSLTKPTLADLMTFLDDYRSAEEPLTNTSPYQDTDDAIQILTAHKAKGAEFKHVFLIACDSLAWGGGKGNNNLLALPKNLMHIRHTGTTADEQLRVFFVALTRAEKTLILTNSMKDFAEKSPKRLEFLHETPSPDGTEILSPLLPSGKVIQHHDDISESDKRRGVRNQWLATYFQLTPKSDPIIQQKLAHFRLSATALTDFIDLSFKGPQVFYQKEMLGAPGEAYSDRAEFGNLIHATLENVTRKNLSRQAALDFFKTQLEASNVPATDRARLLKQGITSLKATLANFSGILKSDGAQAEVNFYQERLLLDDIPITGKIDHLNIDEKAKTIEIYDFKTGKYHADAWTKLPSLYTHMLQLGFYKLLLNLSPTYQKYKVRRGHILYVSPDPVNLQVHDKIYEYNDKDETALKDLCHIVYAHIQSLDYIKDPALSPEPNRSASMTDIRKFIKLLSDTAPKHTS